MATPLGLAILSNNVDAVELLLEHGANPNKYVGHHNVYWKLWHRPKNSDMLIEVLYRYGATVMKPGYERPGKFDRREWCRYTCYVTEVYRGYI